MKISEHFDLMEFVDPQTYKIFGENSIWFIDQRVINAAELLRKLTNKPVTINNWHTGGQFKESGLRLSTTDTGAKYSQHKYGRAVDCKVQGMTGQELRDILFDNWPLFYDIGIRVVEADTPTWLHMDCRNTSKETIIQVPYK